MQLNRSAFAVMIKMSGKSQQLSNLIEDFEMESEGIDDQQELSELFEGLPGSNEILEQWQNASKMRVWYKEKLMKIAEDVQIELKEAQEDEKNKIIAGVSQIELSH